jgi:3-oxoacyl-[acyl-carrier protein] reductase
VSEKREGRHRVEPVRGSSLFTQGTVALVTGSSRGIGAAIALELAAEGAHAIVTYKRNEQLAKDVATRIDHLGGTCSVYPADVCDRESLRALFRSVKGELGRIDVVVSNAGIVRDGFMANMSIAKFDSVIETNLRGSFLCCQEALRTMANQRSGSIVTVASTAAVVGSKGQANYCAAKAGVVAMTRTLALEAANYGVRANVVLPGFVDTDMFKVLPVAARRKAEGEIPLSRLGTPADVARVVAFVASDRAAYMTGTSVIVDGGLTA